MKSKTTRWGLKEFLNEQDPMTGDTMGRPDDMGGDESSQDRNSPNGSYEGHKEEIQDLLDKIGELVEQHSDKQSGSSDKWSHASDLAGVAAKLNEVVDMLSGEGEGEGEPEEPAPEEGNELPLSSSIRGR